MFATLQRLHIAQTHKGRLQTHGTQLYATVVYGGHGATSEHDPAHAHAWTSRYSAADRHQHRREPQAHEDALATYRYRSLLLDQSQDPHTLRQTLHGRKRYRYEPHRTLLFP